MFVFGVDVPLVELIVGAAVILMILLVEIIVVMILQMKQLSEQRKLSKRNEEVVRLLWQIKDKELRLKQIKK